MRNAVSCYVFLPYHPFVHVDSDGTFSHVHAKEHADVGTEGAEGQVGVAQEFHGGEHID
jgi:hypothetical protein